MLKILVGERGRVFTSEEFIEWLWPDSDPAVAAGNIRARIGELRRWLEPHLKQASRSLFILTRPQGYCFNPEANCLVDTEEFSKLVQTGKELESAEQWKNALQTYENASQLYRGDYLLADRYADWATALRTHYQELYLELLARLAECHARLGQYRRAIARSRQILARQPTRESVFGQLMTYLYLAGDQASALQAYEECERILQTELETKPSPAVRQLYEQILQRHLPGIDQKYQPVSVAVTQPVPYSLGQTPFVGRTRELGFLQQRLEEARSQQGSMVLLMGEAGVGKSRLAQEVLAQVTESKATVLRGRCQELAVQLPFQPILQALRLALPDLPPSLFSEISPFWVSQLAKLLPELPSTLGLEAIPGPTLAPEQERQHQFEALTQLCLAVARRSPLLFFYIDDLQWADSTTLDYLNFLAPRLSRESILVVGTYRSEEVGRGRSLISPLRDDQGREIVHQLELPRLSAGEVSQLIQRLTPFVKPQLVERLYAETEGNPFFLINVIQTLFEEGAIRLGPDRAWITEIDDLTETYQELLIPSRVREVFERRIAALDEAERELLQLSSVVGHLVEYPVLKQAWQGPSEKLPRALDKLLERHLLQARGGVQAPLEFSHEKIRQFVYRTLSQLHRQELHGQVGTSIEHVHAGRLEAFYGVLAHHYSLDSAPQKAFAYTLKTLDRAMQLYQNEEALRLVERGLELARQVGESEPRAYQRMRFEFLVRRVEIFHLLGRRAQQDEDIHELLTLSQELQDVHLRAEACWQRARLYLVTSRYPLALEEAKQGYSWLASQLDPDENNRPLSKHLHQLGVIHFYLNDYSRALGYYEEALQRARQNAEAEQAARTLSAIALIHARLGQHAQALEHHQQALQIYRRLHHRKGEGNALTHLGTVYSALGQPQEALAYYSQARAISAEIGDRREQANALMNQGNVEKKLGLFEAALRDYQTTQTLWLELRDRRNYAACLSNLGGIYHELGCRREALRSYEDALKIWEELDNRTGRALILRNIAELHAEQGELEEALGLYRQAGVLYEGLSDAAGYATCLHEMGVVYYQKKDWGAALEAVEQSLALGEQTHSMELQIRNHSLRGMLLLAKGALEQAVTASQTALELLSDEQMLEHPHQLYFRHSQVLAAAGQVPASKRFLEKAVKIVQERANQLHDANLRHNYLTHALLNVEILKAWDTVKSSSA